MRFAIAALAWLLISCGDAPDAAGDAAPAETPIQIPVVIPTQFWGVWDYVDGTCSPESDMRMEISSKEILFYESIGALTSVKLEDESSLVLGLAMEGEGERWDQELRLALVGEGDAQVLETSDGSQPHVHDEYPSKRCPA